MRKKIRLFENQPVKINIMFHGYTSFLIIIAGFHIEVFKIHKMIIMSI